MIFKKQLNDVHHFLQDETIILIYNEKMAEEVQRFFLKKNYCWRASGCKVINLEKEIGFYSKDDPAIIILDNLRRRMMLGIFFEEYNLGIEEVKEKEEFIVPSFCSIREVEI